MNVWKNFFYLLFITSYHILPLFTFSFKSFCTKIQFTNFVKSSTLENDFWSMFIFDIYRKISDNILYNHVYIDSRNLLLTIWLYYFKGHREWFSKYQNPNHLLRHVITVISVISEAKYSHLMMPTWKNIHLKIELELLKLINMVTLKL